MAVSIAETRVSIPAWRSSFAPRWAYASRMNEPAPSPRFRIGMTARVTAVVMLVASLVLVVNTVASRLAFQSRFLSYVNEQEAAILARMAEQIAEIYGRYGDWDALSEAIPPRRLLLWSARVSSREVPGNRIDALVDAPVAPSPLSSSLAAPPESLLSPSRSELAGPSSRPLRRPTMSRLALVDQAGQVRVPAPMQDLGEAEVRRQPIRWAGEVVGYITLYPVRRLDQETDLRFEADLLQTLWVISALILLVAGFAGWRLSKSLLAPVRVLASGAKALAAGRYGTRLQLARSDEFGALGRDFNRLAEALEQARSARQRWLADVAHELRTPLTVLRGELEALEDGVRPLTPQNLASLNTEVRQLGRLVEDLHALALADVGALAFEYEPCQPQQLLEEAVARHQRRFEEAGLALTLAAAPVALTLSLDPLRIAQLLDNLLENALRYTDAPGEVRLGLEPRGQGVHISVEDSAPGVSDEAREAMFTRFWRQEASRARASGGAGLGLAIVRRISRAHEGEAFAEPSPLGGVRISIMLRTQEPKRGRP